jgi:hypothetical protein
VTVRYFAGARAASGVDTETREAGTIDQLVGQIVDAHGEKLQRVLTACSFLVTEPPPGTARWCCHPGRWWTCCPRSPEADRPGRIAATN